MSRATVRTTHDDPTALAAALAPDNTTEMGTEVVDGAVETTIDRPTAAGLRPTTDDYLVCLSAAMAVVEAARPRTTAEQTDDQTRSTTERTDDRSNTNP
jgi:hypothetical protein